MKTSVLQQENSEVATSISPMAKRIVSALVLFQFVCLLTSLSANLSPSIIQSRFLDFLGPYIVATGQDYGAVAIEWTHGEEIEFPMVVQVHQTGAPANEWTSLPPQGVRVSDERPVDWTSSRWANFSRIVRLLYADSGDNEILGEIIVDTVNAQTSRTLGSIDKARLLSPVVINYRQYEEMMEVGNVTIAEAWPDSVVYTADLVTTSDGTLVVSPTLPAARVSKSTEEAATASTSDSGASQ